MKFSDGNWMTREGYEINGAAHLHDVQVKGQEIIAYVAPRPVKERWGQLDCPLLTIRFHAPLPDVIGVKITHFEGIAVQHPQFELYTDSQVQVNIEQLEDKVVMTNGRLQLVIRKEENWSIDFYQDGNRITGSGFKGMAHVSAATGTTYVREQLDLGVGEYVYGLGERFTPFVKNGQQVEIWNCDGGTSTEQAYKNIPFYISTGGYGVFVNQPDLVSFEVASEKVSKVQFSVQGESLEYFVIGGPTMKEVLGNYTSLTGKPALPPAWSFGLWLSTSFTTSYDEATVNSFIDGMFEREIPLHVFHFDCFWMKSFHWTNFEWDADVFPDPEGILNRLKDKGLRISVWINPYIAQQSALFEEGMKNGYLLKKPNGDVWQWDKWQPGMGIVDFTNPAACEWYAGYLRRLVKMGVNCFKTDFGERIPTDVVYYDGSNPHKMHNYYTHLYNKVVFDVLKEQGLDNEAIVFARSATAGGQQFPVHWGGDCFANYESMAESLRGGLSLGMSGFGFWSHDIGGFESTATADVYKRWTVFGLLSSHSRLHGNHSYRVPWAFDDEASLVMRKFTELKCKLMPYLYGAAVEAAHDGIPTMRSMVLEFEEDPSTHALDMQYMLGQSLLVAPIFREDGKVRLYLPQGTWTHLLTGEQVEGGVWRQEQHDYMSLPLYVRPNTVLPIGANATRPDYRFTDGVELHVYALEDGREVTTVIPDLAGKTDLTVVVKREGQSIQVKADGFTDNWSIVLQGIQAVAAVDGGQAEAGEAGVRIQAASNQLLITL